jgi:nicotinamide mononucleotide transporter
VIDALARALHATSALEALAVILGVLYVLLVLKRNRLGWIAGGASSLIYIYLAARAGLPMQSALQCYYVLMSVYGWHQWSRPQQQAQGIAVWPLRWHLLTLLAIGALSVLTAHWLQRETHAAWPYLDSMTTWVSLFATWLVARMKLENWLYWIATDAVVVFLYAIQGYLFSAGLYLTYLVVATFGFLEWRQKYRLQRA